MNKLIKLTKKEKAILKKEVLLFFNYTSVHFDLICQAGVAEVTILINISIAPHIICEYF